MATETQLLKLDLDTKDFIEKTSEADAKLGQIGDPSKLTGLIDGLASVTKVLGVIGTIGLAAKAALDLSLEAENVRLVNQQFEILTRNAGLAGSTLKDSLTQIADGLVDDTDLLKAANAAVVQLGGNAERLPEIFGLAKSVTTAFGGDILDNFSRLNEAVATGNLRGLRQYGLIVDQDLALRNYARTVGTTVDALSEQERRSAILNAILERGKTALAGVSDEVAVNTNAWTRLNVALGQLKESAAIAFDRVFGGVIKAEITGFTAIANDLTRFLTAKFGSGPEAARAQFERLTEQINASGANVFDLQTKIETLSARYGEGAKYLSDYTEAVRLLAFEEERLKGLRAQAAELKGVAGGGPEETAQASADRTIAVDEEAAARRLEVASKFEADLYNLQLNRVNQEVQVATSIEEVDRLQNERRVLMSQLVLEKEQQAQAAVLEGKMTADQAEAQSVELRKALVADLRSVEMRAEDERLRALQNFAAVSANTASGFVAGFKAASANASRDVGNFSKLGQTAFNSFSANAANAFMELGKGTKSATEVMKSFFLNALADIAQSQGSIMLANIYNPAGMAAGAGLLVLAGLLRAMAGGGGGSSALGSATVSAGNSGGFGTGGTMAPAVDVAQPSLEESRRRREVQLVIQGNYFDTEATNRRLMEMIRSETDATGFSYVQIGQGA